MLRDRELSCPRCDQPMERGHLVARFPGIRWSRGGLAFTWLGERRQQRMSKGIGLFRQTAVEAARCHSCRIGVFSDSAESLGGDSFWDGVT
ncbi:MAG: PF20097 family protein [Microthrixaceae bacterium]